MRAHSYRVLKHLVTQKLRVEQSHAEAEETRREGDLEMLSGKVPSLIYRCSRTRLWCTTARRTY